MPSGPPQVPRRRSRSGSSDRSRRSGLGEFGSSLIGSMPMKKLVVLAVAGVLLSAATPPQASVDIDVDGLRNAKGSVHACLTRSPGHFPDCKSDPAALRQTVTAAAHRFHFEHLAPG